MTDHPLTDEMIDVLWDKTRASKIDWDEPIDSEVIRAAYDLGADQQLEQVIDWIETYLTAGDVISESLKKAMRPQEEES